MSVALMSMWSALESASGHAPRRPRVGDQPRSQLRASHIDPACKPFSPNRGSPKEPAAGSFIFVEYWQHPGGATPDHAWNRVVPAEEESRVFPQVVERAPDGALRDALAPGQ
jgi:hypothetical protein